VGGRPPTEEPGVGHTTLEDTGDGLGHPDENRRWLRPPPRDSEGGGRHPQEAPGWYRPPLTPIGGGAATLRFYFGWSATHSNNNVLLLLFFI